MPALLEMTFSLWISHWLHSLLLICINQVSSLWCSSCLWQCLSSSTNVVKFSFYWYSGRNFCAWRHWSIQGKYNVCFTFSWVHTRYKILCHTIENTANQNTILKTIVYLTALHPTFPSCTGHMHVAWIVFATAFSKTWYKIVMKEHCMKVAHTRELVPATACTVPATSPCSMSNCVNWPFYFKICQVAGTNFGP